MQIICLDSGQTDSDSFSPTVIHSVIQWFNWHYWSFLVHVYYHY